MRLILETLRYGIIHPRSNSDAGKLTFPMDEKPCTYVNTSIRQGNMPDSKVHGADMGPIWGRQDPGGTHVGPMNFAICDVYLGGFISQSN